MAFKHTRLNSSGSIELMLYGNAESNLTKAGTSSTQQGIAKTGSNKLEENVAASSYQPTGEPDEIICKTNSHTLKDSNNLKSCTKARVIYFMVIVVVGVVSSAITVAVKDIYSSKQDNYQLNSGTKKEKHTDMLTSKDCNGTVLTLIANNTQEILTSPGYPFSHANNISCSWLIDSGIDGQPIAIYLEHYNMNCSMGDSMSVYNGSRTSDFALVNDACGRNKATQLYVSSDRYMLVTFTSDSANKGQGFQLTYVNGSKESLYKCPVSQLSVSASETPGKITSPGYPFNTLLANYLACTWLIDSGVDRQPIIFFVKVCTVEFPYGQKLIIYDGSTTYRRMFDITCQPGLTGRYGPLVTSNRYALVSFDTLSTNQGDGFQLTYFSVPDKSATGCNSTHTLTASTNIQYLTSEGFPSHYSSNSNCSWLISTNSTDSPSTISIAIVWSHIELCVDCGCDYLKIYDGSSANDTTLMTRNCDPRMDPDVTPTTYTSTSNNILVVFASDHNAEGRGFIIKYSVTMENITTTS